MAKKIKRRGGVLVKEAISDLDREIGRIRKEKNSLNSELKRIEKDLGSTQILGKKLQEKIAELENNELVLMDKKKKLKQKNDSLGERLTKVETIKEQLDEV